MSSQSTPPTSSGLSICLRAPRMALSAGRRAFYLRYSIAVLTGQKSQCMRGGAQPRTTRPCGKIPGLSRSWKRHLESRSSNQEYTKSCENSHPRTNNLRSRGDWLPKRERQPTVSRDIRRAAGGWHDLIHDSHARGDPCNLCACEGSAGSDCGCEFDCSNGEGSGSPVAGQSVVWFGSRSNIGCQFNILATWRNRSRTYRRKGVLQKFIGVAAQISPSVEQCPNQTSFRTEDCVDSVPNGRAKSCPNWYLRVP